MLCYKYRAFDKKAYEIFKERNLFFSSTENLNDPLDSSINIENEYHRAKQVINQSDNHPQRRKSFLVYLLNSHNKFVDPHSGKRITLNRAVQHYITTLGILALSKTPKDALLWSHYADGHKGICFGFETDELSMDGVYIKEEISYLEKPAYLDLFIKLTEMLGEIVRPWDNHHHSEKEADDFYGLQLVKLIRTNLLVKSKKWEYEQEYRLISSNIGIHQFQPGALKEVIFGTKTSAADIKNTIDFLSGAEYSHVKLKKVVHLEGTFEFDVQEYTDKK